MGQRRGDWKRKVAEATGLPFSRVRALRRLIEGPLTLRDLAESMASDAPAATLAVNDLEERGLVRREPHPDDRRAKLVTLTTEGRRVVGLARKVTDRAPDTLAALSAKDVAALWADPRATRREEALTKRDTQGRHGAPPPPRGPVHRALPCARPWAAASPGLGDDIPHRRLPLSLGR